MTKDQIIMGTLIKVTHPYTDAEIIGCITYIGKYGFTVNDSFPIPFKSKYLINNIKFISYSKKPNGNSCSTLEEIKEYYPEYFI